MFIKLYFRCASKIFDEKRHIKVLKVGTEFNLIRKRTNKRNFDVILRDYFAYYIDVRKKQYDAVSKRNIWPLCYLINKQAMSLIIDLKNDIIEFKRIVKAAYDISKMKTDLSTIFDVNKILIPTIERFVEGFNNSLTYKTTTSKVHIL